MGYAATIATKDISVVKINESCMIVIEGGEHLSMCQIREAFYTCAALESSDEIMGPSQFN